MITDEQHRARQRRYPASGRGVASFVVRTHRSARCSVSCICRDYSTFGQLPPYAAVVCLGFAWGPRLLTSTQDVSGHRSCAVCAAGRQNQVKSVTSTPRAPYAGTAWSLAPAWLVAAHSRRMGCSKAAPLGLESITFVMQSWLYRSELLSARTVCNCTVKFKQCCWQFAGAVLVSHDNTEFNKLFKERTLMLALLSGTPQKTVRTS